MRHIPFRSRARAVLALAFIALCVATETAGAATYYLQPNSTVSNAWTVAPAGSTVDSVLDDAVLSPTAPSTASDYINANANGPRVAEVHVGTQSIAPGDTVSTTIARAYLSTGSGRTVTLELMTGATSLASTTIAANSAAAWRSVSSASALTQAQVDDLRIKVTLNGSGGSTASFVYAAYVELGTAGVLSTSTSGTPSFAVTLDGTDKSPTHSVFASVTDTRNAPTVWNLTFATTAFSTGGASPSTLAANASTLTSASSGCSVAPCVAPTNSVGYPITLTAGGAPVKGFNAASGTGTGQLSVTPNIQVSVPANANAGTYTATMTVTVANGP